MRHRRLPAVIIFSTFLASLLFLIASASDEVGKTLYETKKCATCHGPDGKSDTKLGKMVKSPDLTVLPWKHGSTIGEVEKLIREGEGKMPKYKDKLTPAEINAVAKYVMELCGVGDEEAADVSSGGSR